jgi:hypothetical protein
MDQEVLARNQFQEAVNRLEVYFPKKIKTILNELNKPDGVFNFIKIVDRSLRLIDYFPTNANGTESKARKIWNDVGFIYRLISGKITDALIIYQQEYQRTLAAQKKYNKRIHKGAILYWISECYEIMGFDFLAKRMMMLALCEDSISYEGSPDANNTGTYHRLVLKNKLSREQYFRYAKDFWSIYKKDDIISRFPEWLLQNVDDEWCIEIPSPNESFYYSINQEYCNYLKRGLRKTRGLNLEYLAQYLLSNIPGFLPRRRLIAESTDYDILCKLQGVFSDFRSEIGKYFICECKDISEKINVSIIYKFYRVLKSSKANLGLIFSIRGESGSDQFKFANREIIKIFQSDEIIILIFDLEDIQKIIKGENFQGMIRKKYEGIRLDLKRAAQ